MSRIFFVNWSINEGIPKFENFALKQKIKDFCANIKNILSPRLSYLTKIQNNFNPSKLQTLESHLNSRSYPENVSKAILALKTSLPEAILNFNSF